MDMTNQTGLINELPERGKGPFIPCRLPCWPRNRDTVFLSERGEINTLVA